MKYIYYILGILILITIGLAVRLSGLKMEVSEPALVINDRIISKSELDEMGKVGSYHSSGKNFYEAVIVRELLIQEAVRSGIHKEETFRKSVEAYYEQSLVKILIDRKIKEFSPVITEDMVARYLEMAAKTVTYTKIVYENEDAFQKGEVKSTVQQAGEFDNLSDSLKFTLFMLSIGETSPPGISEEGYIAYRLDKTSASSDTEAPDSDEVRAFLMDQSKNAMLDAWMKDVRKSADIQILSSDMNQQGGAGT